MNEDFYKFPSTPHLAVLGIDNMRDDKVMQLDEQKDFIKNYLFVEEKVDGANLGISFDSSGNVLLQNRGSYINGPYLGQWVLLERWLKTKVDILFDYLGTQFIVFGEWCYAEHTISYTNLPDWFLGFDVFDKNKGLFLSFKRRNEIMEECGISTVPLISKGIFTLHTLIEFLNTPSHLSKTPLEGIYLRYDNYLWLGGRAKIVREKFMQANEEHWSRKKIKPNKIVYENGTNI